MKVTFKELGAMLFQFQRAATSTQSKCQSNQEEGYEARRADDVAHARGRLEAVAIMQVALAELQAKAGTSHDVDSREFFASFAEDAAETARILANSQTRSFHTFFGRHEAFTDVLTAVQSWEHLPSPDA